MIQVWPFLGAALKETINAIQHLEHMAYNVSIPSHFNKWFQVDLIPYGTQFYTPEATSRVFDLVQFMATANAFRKVATRVDGIIYEVDVKLLLPGGRIRRASADVPFQMVPLDH